MDQLACQAARTSTRTDDQQEDSPDNVADGILRPCMLRACDVSEAGRCRKADHRVLVFPLPGPLRNLYPLHKSVLRTERMP